MGKKSQATLYFVAAALFLIATIISVLNDGFNIKSIAGMLMFAAMGMMGMNLRKATS